MTHILVAARRPVGGMSRSTWNFGRDPTVAGVAMSRGNIGVRDSEERAAQSSRSRPPRTPRTDGRTNDAHGQANEGMSKVVHETERRGRRSKVVPNLDLAE